MRAGQFWMPSSATRCRLMCEVEPNRRSCRSWRKPFVIAIATTREATPAATPTTEMPVMMPTKACLLLARKYRDAINSSKRMKKLSAVSGQLSAKLDYNDCPESDPVMTRSSVEFREDRMHTLTIGNEFGAEALLQFGILHSNHHRAGHDRKCGQEPTDDQPCSHAPSQHFTEMTEIDGMADSGADSGCDESLSMVSGTNFRQASQLRPAEMRSGT